MKTLLMNPPLTSSNRYGKRLGKLGPSMIPEGLAAIAACALASGFVVEMLDAMALNYSVEETLDYVRQGGFDLIGMTMLTPMFAIVAELVGKIRKTSPSTKIVVGGAHPTVLQEQTLAELPEIDFAVVGEGDVTFVELLEALSGKRRLDTIAGLIFRDSGGGVVKNAPRPVIDDLDSLPTPARHLLPMALYKPAGSYYRRLPSYYLMTARGCPYACTYCSQPLGRKYRHWSIARIIREMEVLIREYGAREIIFRDETFTVDKRHIRELCGELMKKGLHRKVAWSCTTRVDCVTPELLTLMKAAGCWEIHYGIESGSQRLLDLIRKGITLGQVRDAVKWTRAAGIEIKGFFILGLPTETLAESRQTIEFAKELDMDWAQFTLAVPFPGTPMFDLAKTTGRFLDKKWESYQTWAGWAGIEPVYVPENREIGEIQALQRKALKEFYLRPKVILRHMVTALKHPGLLAKYWQGAAALLERPGRGSGPPSRPDEIRGPIAQTTESPACGESVGSR
jgi:anaerobic magnesium-protoporphyrin IX monomethyl ester cyclase